ALPAPFGHACVAQNGVRFCPTTSLADRVPTWDGLPLDIDVTLPPTGDGPFPTIFMLHGLGGSKVDFDAPPPAANAPSTLHLPNAPRITTPCSPPTAAISWSTTAGAAGATRAARPRRARRFAPPAGSASPTSAGRCGTRST